MRRLLLALGLLALAVVVALVLVPVLMKDRVVSLVLGEVSARVDADVAVGSASVSLFESFPDLSVEIADLAVTGRGPFAGVELARAGHLGVTLDLMSVVKGGPVRVTGLALSDAKAHVLVDEQGRSNTDLGGGEAAPTQIPAEPSEPTELWLRDVAIERVSVLYEDKAADRRIEVDDFGFTGDAEVGEDVAMRAKLAAASVTVRDGATTWLDHAKLGSDLDVRFAPATGALKLGDSQLRLNELAVKASGTVAPQPKGLDLDLAFAADKTSFKGLLSLIPGAYTPDFGGVTADGQLGVSGSVKGLLPDASDDLPAFALAVNVADGRFQYPGLPASVSDIQLDLAVKSPGGPPDTVVVDVPRFHVAVDGSPLDGRLSLRTPVSDPAVDTRVKGRLDLARLAAAFPDAVSGWTGKLDVDVDLAGKVSDFSAGNVDAVRAAGTFGLADATWTDPSQPLPITVQELKLAVDPRKLDLTSFRLRFGRSDVAAKGTVENAIPWALSDGTLVGRLDVTSGMLDLTPWSGTGEETTGASSAPAPSDESSVLVVPKNLDLALSVDAARVLWSDWDLAGVTGRARVKDGAIALQDLKARTLGGEVGISGTYRAETDAGADVDVRVAATDLGAADALTRVDTVRRLLPGLEAVTGRLGAGFSLRTKLGRDLSPDLASLVSSGRLSAARLSSKPAFLAPVAKFVGDDRFSTLLVEGGDIGFSVNAGKLKIDRIPLSFGAAKGELKGNTGILDDSLDLVLKVAVPASAVKGGDALKAIAGKKLQTVDLTAAIGGTWKAPNVKVGLGDSLQAVVDSVVADAKAVVDQKVGEAVDALVAQAKAQGDKLVAEAEKQADKLRDEAKRQTQKLRDEADRQGKKLVKEAKGNPIQEAAAKEAASRLRKEADKQADKLDKEADKQAKAVIAEARKQADKLVAEAEAKAGR